jgi:hypothetical protein
MDATVSSLVFSQFGIVGLIVLAIGGTVFTLNTDLARMRTDLQMELTRVSAVASSLEQPELLDPTSWRTACRLLAETLRDEGARSDAQRARPQPLALPVGTAAPHGPLPTSCR